MSTVNQEIAQDAKSAIQAKADRLDELSLKIVKIDAETSSLQFQIAENNERRREFVKESMQLLQDLHLISTFK